MLTPLATGIYASLGVVGGAGLALGGFAYAAVWPASQIFGKTLIAPARPGELALTFDDGPNPAWTPRLLDILAAHNVKATFFMVGHFAKVERDLARRVADAGHLVGNHSWSHPNLARTAAAQVREELAHTSEVLEQIIAKPIRFFRPPYGARRPFVLRTARELAMTPVTWNAMTSDWSDTHADHIASELMKKIDGNQREGWATNIVLHDGKHNILGANRGPSVAAAGQLIARYKSTHKFVTLDEWIQEAPKA